MAAKQAAICIIYTTGSKFCKGKKHKDKINDERITHRCLNEPSVQLFHVLCLG